MRKLPKHLCPRSRIIEKASRLLVYLHTKAGYLFHFKIDSSVILVVKPGCADTRSISCSDTFLVKRDSPDTREKHGSIQSDPESFDDAVVAVVSLNSS